MDALYNFAVSAGIDDEDAQLIIAEAKKAAAATDGLERDSVPNGNTILDQYRGRR